MKKTLLCGLLLLGSTVFAQKSDNVGIGTTKPDASALLDLSSTSKGLLLPRMTQDQRNAIKNPAAGLIIFQTDQAIGTYTYDGTAWTASTNSTLSAQSWSTQGNSIDGTDFIGSINDFPLKFKINGIKAGFIDNTDYDNAFLGRLSGASITPSGSPNLPTSGAYNVGFGSKTLQSTTTGAWNVAIGAAALYQNTTGYSNLGLGTFAKFTNTTGSQNIHIGAFSGFNSNGNNNIAIGVGTLENNTGGNQNVAIGTDAGKSNSGSGSIFVGFQAGTTEPAGNKLYISNSNSTTPLIYGSFATDFLAIGGVDAAVAKRDNLASSYGLLVRKGILTEKLKVATMSSTEWADYVFEADYKKMSLEEVESFIIVNKHLPNVPTTKEMILSGNDVMKTDAKLLEKIEELTLYLIEINKEVKALKALNKKLRK